MTALFVEGTVSIRWCNLSLNYKKANKSVFEIRAETCRTETQFCYLYMTKKGSLLDRRKFRQSGSVVWHLFRRLKSEHILWDILHILHFNKWYIAWHHYDSHYFHCCFTGEFQSPPYLTPKPTGSPSIGRQVSALSDTDRHHSSTGSS